VELKQLRMGIYIGTHMFPFSREGSIPFSPEQGFGSYRFHPCPIGQPAITGIISLEAHRFLVEGIRRIHKHKGIVPGGSDKAVYAKTAYCGAIPAQYVFLRSYYQVKARLFCPGTKGSNTVLGTGKHIPITPHPFEGLHDQQDQRLSSQR
jgi:hypothetical protein